jgi:hypothetical protein
MYEYQVTKDITAVDYLYEKIFKKVKSWKLKMVIF